MGTGLPTLPAGWRLLVLWSLDGPWPPPRGGEAGGEPGEGAWIPTRGRWVQSPLPPHRSLFTVDECSSVGWCSRPPRLSARPRSGHLEGRPPPQPKLAICVGFPSGPGALGLGEGVSAPRAEARGRLGRPPAGFAQPWSDRSASFRGFSSQALPALSGAARCCLCSLPGISAHCTF